MTPNTTFIKTVLIIGFMLLTGTTSAGAKELIAYSGFTDGYWQIWTMEPDASRQIQITHSPQDKRSPIWVNNGRQLAFRTNNGRLFLVDRDGGREQEILEQYHNINNPDFSDRTAEIIFVRFHPTATDISDIWKSDLTGKSALILTKDRVLKYQPRFSPDGKSIVFVRADKDKKGHHLWLMDADGSDQRQLTEGGGFDTLPAFSPDQGSITFTSNRDGEGYDIYLLELKTKKMKRITEHAGLDTYSSFSPDGSKIIFVSNRGGYRRGGNQQIWMMAPDGSEAVQITSGENECIDPVWGKIAE